ncbi:MAG TPA: hypothetical protein PLJ78_06915 [Anaerolineae bacterium]|nr:hypothetical protein [Anaerolineae bacterium]HQK13654.1 hypothetical protein [Anaerolineae bacterium]
MRRQWVVWITVLFVLSLGCSLFSGKTTPTPAPTAQPTAVQEDKPQEDKPQEDKGESPTATQAPAATSAPATAEPEDEGTLNIDPEALKDLNSYRMKMVWNFTAEDGTVEEFNIEEEAIRDPLAQHYTMNSAEGSMEFVLIGDTQWSRFGDEWMQTTAGEGESLGQFGQSLVQPDEMLSGANKDAFKYVGKETVKGLNTRHYQLKDNSWDAAWGFNVTDVEDARMDIWIVDEKNLPQVMTRFEMTVKGTFEDERKGTLALTWEIFDFNVPFTIEPPAGAANIGLPAGLELCPNAADVTVMGKISMFTCPASVKDTATFYTEALDKAGWTAGDVTDMEGLLMGSWTKGDETLNLTITANEEKGGSNVMISIGE